MPQTLASTLPSVEFFCAPGKINCVLALAARRVPLGSSGRMRGMLLHRLNSRRPIPVRAYAAAQRRCWFLSARRISSERLSRQGCCPERNERISAPSFTCRSDARPKPSQTLHRYRLRHLHGSASLARNILTRCDTTPRKLFLENNLRLLLSDAAVVDSAILHRHNEKWME